MKKLRMLRMFVKKLRQKLRQKPPSTLKSYGSYASPAHVIYAHTHVRTQAQARPRGQTHIYRSFRSFNNKTNTYGVAFAVALSVASVAFQK